MPRGPLWLSWVCMVSSFLPQLMLLATRLMLPDNVQGPGASRVAVGAGVEGRVPAVDVRVGILDALALTVDGVWNPKAPRLGMQLRGAAGHTSRGLFALAWAEGHLRPVITTDVTQSVAGSDFGAGLGLVVATGWASMGVDGGVALGLPLADVNVSGVDRTQVDQQGGFFGLQRAFLGVDLGDHLGFLFLAAFAVPIDSVTFRRRNEDLVGDWDFRLGGRVVVRF